MPWKIFSGARLGLLANPGAADDVLPHELGHVFDLFHTQNPFNLMCGPVSYLDFLPSLQYAYGDQWLALGSTDAISAPAILGRGAFGQYPVRVAHALQTQPFRSKSTK